MVLVPAWLYIVNLGASTILILSISDKGRRIWGNQQLRNSIPIACPRALQSSRWTCWKVSLYERGNETKYYRHHSSVVDFRLTVNCGSCSSSFVHEKLLAVIVPTLNIPQSWALCEILTQRQGHSSEQRLQQHHSGNELRAHGCLCTTRSALKRDLYHEQHTRAPQNPPLLYILATDDFPNFPSLAIRPSSSLRLTFHEAESSVADLYSFASLPASSRKNLGNSSLLKTRRGDTVEVKSLPIKSLRS